MSCLLVLGFIAVFSGCSGPKLVIMNESAAWLRFEAASEVDARQAYLAGPLAGDGTVAFGVPPGGKHVQQLEPGGSIFVRRRLGLVLRVRAGPNPSSPDARNPMLVTAYSIRMPPPGPYALRFVGEPGTVEVQRVKTDGIPTEDDRLRVLPEASLVW